jgi:hypothetical protein
MGLPYAAFVLVTIISHTRYLKNLRQGLGFIEHVQRAAFDKRLGKT